MFNSFFTNPIVATAAPVLTYRTSTFSSTNSASYTFSSLAIGTASATRLVIVSISTNQTGSSVMSSVTIGGVSATLINRIANTIAYAIVPTGTTASVVVTHSASVGRCAISVYTLTGYTSSTPAISSYDTDSSPTVILPVATNSVSIAVGFVYNSAIDMTWSLPLVQDYETALEDSRHSFASKASLPWGSTTFSMSGIPSVGGIELLVAVWR